MNVVSHEISGIFHLIFWDYGCLWIPVTVESKTLGGGGGLYSNTPFPSSPVCPDDTIWGATPQELPRNVLRKQKPKTLLPYKDSY